MPVVQYAVHQTGCPTPSGTRCPACRRARPAGSAPPSCSLPSRLRRPRLRLRPRLLQGVPAKNLSYYQSKSPSAEKHSLGKIHFIILPRPRRKDPILELSFTNKSQRSNRRIAEKNSLRSVGISSCQDFSILLVFVPKWVPKAPNKSGALRAPKR